MKLSYYEKIMKVHIIYLKNELKWFNNLLWDNLIYVGYQMILKLWNNLMSIILICQVLTLNINA